MDQQLPMVAAPLPSYRQPPVTEVALSVQFADEIRLRTVDLGALRDAFVDEYPETEDQRPLPRIELGPVQVEVGFEVIDEPTLPRVWFLNRERSRLVQFQTDRLIVNWRRREGEEYPRYETGVRPMFEDAWQRFTSAMDHLHVKVPTIDLVEIYYVNPIGADQGWNADLASLVAPWSGQHSDSTLPAPWGLWLQSMYDIDDTTKLVITGQPARGDDTPGYLLHVSARGSVESGLIEDALKKLDLGREWIVRGFTSFTTPEMHENWGREDA